MPHNRNFGRTKYWEDTVWCKFLTWVNCDEIDVFFCNSFIKCDCLSKNPHIVCTKIEFNFITTIHRHTKYLSIPPISNVNQSAFLEGIFPTLQNHNWNNGTNEGYQFGGLDLRLLPLPLWPTNVTWATVWALWLLQGYPNQGLCCLLPHPTLPPIPPTPSVSYTDISKDKAKISWNLSISAT